MTRKVPIVSKELLDFVEVLFPDRCPSPDATDREVWMSVGAVKVVKKLRQLYADQQRNVLAQE